MNTYSIRYVARHAIGLACLLALPATGWAACAANEIEMPPIGVLAGPVCVPRDDFQFAGLAGVFVPNAQASDSGIVIEREMYQGDRWITADQENVGMLGLTSQQVSNAIRRFPRNASYVFAQYSSENSTGRITVQKVEKTPTGVLQVYQADFTPWSGRLWKAQGKYRSASEISSQSAGNNPFALFEGPPGDPVFYNLNWSALVVAVGHAMRRYGASVGYISVDSIIPNPPVTTCSGSAWGFKKKCTTTQTANASPVWYLATPVEASLAGEQTSYCVINTGAGCDDPAHVAYSGIVATLMNGGNMPSPAQQVAQTSSSKSGWGFFTGLLDLVFTPALGPSMHTGTTVGGAGGVLAGGIMAVNPLTSVAGTAGGTQAAQANPPGSLMQQAQQAVQGMHVAPQMAGAGFTGDNQLYHSAAWQTDSYVEYNGTAEMRQRYNACVQQGLSGAAAEQCAAPQAQAIVP